MEKKMRAAVFEKEGILKIIEMDAPKIGKPDDVIIKVEICSICGTDVHIMSVPPRYRARPGTIIGHELAGEVVEIGTAVRTLHIGDKVVVNPNDYCGVCRYCRANMPNHCENIIPMGIEADGGFAQYVKTSEKTVYAIPKELSLDLAAFAEPLACVINGVNKINLKPSDSVLVMGAGTIGLLFIQMMKAAGAYPIIVTEPAPLRMEYAKICGADYVIDPNNGNIEEQISEITPYGVDFAIDAVGSQLLTGIKNVHRGGSVLVFGFNSQSTSEVAQSIITNHEIKILGSWLANATFQQAVQILGSGILKLQPLITHRLTLNQLEEGIEILRKGQGIEILVNPWG